MKKAIEKTAVFKKIDTKFFRDSENTMVRNGIYQFTRHAEGSLLIAHVATSGTKVAFAPERNKLKFPTIAGRGCN